MFEGLRKKIAGLIAPRREQVNLEQLAANMARLRATYDAARNGNEYKNIWSNADFYDADSANSKTVRHTLISRSRYEIANNGFTDGIIQTYATDIVGVGPNLRMQTGSQQLNQLIEFTWSNWMRAVQLRNKLWTMAHAKPGDGEAFGVIRRNPGVRHPIKLDVQLYEAEQCQTPWLPYDEPGYIDGVRFDEYGNPIWYEFLLEHPGSNDRVNFDSETEKVPADYVLHWFKKRRPGQHRGIPELASTLNIGAAARRMREAVLAAHETAADFSLICKTQMTPDEADAVAPFTTMDIEKRMMAFMPNGWDPFQLKAEFPATNHEMFVKLLINEQARPLSMPLNKAACNSADYNYASGRLDHQTYYASIDIARADCNEMVLDKLFRAWLPEAVMAFGWFGGNPRAISDGGLTHTWDWPKHQVADVKAEADANATKLQSGQIGLHRIYSDGGTDLEDEIPAMARTFNVDEDEIRKRLLDICLPGAPQVAAPQQQPSETPDEPEATAALRQLIPPYRNGETNGH